MNLSLENTIEKGIPAMPFPFIRRRLIDRRQVERQLRITPHNLDVFVASGDLTPIRYDPMEFDRKGVERFQLSLPQRHRAMIELYRSGEDMDIR